MRPILFIIGCLSVASTAAQAAPAILVAPSSVPLAALEATHNALTIEGIDLLPLRESNAQVVGAVELNACTDAQLASPAPSECTAMLGETAAATRFFMLQIMDDAYQLHDLDTTTGKASTSTVKTRDDLASLAASLVVQLLRPTDYLGEMLVLGHPLTPCNIDMGDLGRRDLGPGESFRLTVPPGVYELQYVCADDAFPVSIEVLFGAPTTVDAAQQREALEPGSDAKRNSEVPSDVTDPPITSYAVLGVGVVVAAAGLFVLGGGFLLNALANISWQFDASQQPTVDIMHTASLVGMGGGLVFALLGAGVATTGGVLMVME